MLWLEICPILMIALGISSLQEVDKIYQSASVVCFWTVFACLPWRNYALNGSLISLKRSQYYCNTIGPGKKANSSCASHSQHSTLQRLHISCLIQLERLSNLRTLACKQLCPDFAAYRKLFKFLNLDIDFGCRCAFHLPWLNDPTELTVTVGRNCYGLNPPLTYGPGLRRIPLTFSARPYLEDLTIRSEIYLHSQPPDQWHQHHSTAFVELFKTA